MYEVLLEQIVRN